MNLFIVGFLTGILVMVLAMEFGWIECVNPRSPAWPWRKKYAKVAIKEPLWLGRNVPQPDRDSDHWPNKIQGIRIIRTVTNFGLRDSKEMTEGKSFVLPRDQANDLARQLWEMNVRIVVEPQRNES